AFPAILGDGAEAPPALHRPLDLRAPGTRGTGPGWPARAPAGPAGHVRRRGVLRRVALRRLPPAGRSDARRPSIGEPGPARTGPGYQGTRVTSPLAAPAAAGPPD